VVNNNSNRNESNGPADIENNNANETQLALEGRGGGIVNNNSNVNRVVTGGAVLLGVGSADAEEGVLPRTRITNNNGNKNVVRRVHGAQKATHSPTTVQ